MTFSPKKIALILAAFLLTGGALLARASSYKHAARKPKAPVATAPVAPPPDHTRPFAVMIDNHPDARPQSGIAKADVVWEAPVEGGLTRDMAIFRSASATEIGPVRSARPYFLTWAREFDAAYAHIGGSDEALSDLANGAFGLDNADGIADSLTFWRDTRRDAPHNAYTSSEKMRALIASNAWHATTDAIDLTPRGDAASGTPAIRVDLVSQENGEQAEFQWDAKTKSYDLWRAGMLAHERDGLAIAPKTVVVLEMNIVPINDPHAKGLIGLQSLGSGKATVFQNGRAVAGTWKKASPQAPTIVIDANGQKIPFASGQVWYEVIGINRGGSVTVE